MGVFSTALLVIGLLCAAAAVFAWLHRSQPANRAVTLLLAATGWWNAAYAFELADPTLAGKLRWAQLQYLGIAVVPLAVLLFALSYRAGGRPVSARSIALLSVVPALVVVGVWTNDVHGLIWQDVAVGRWGSIGVLHVSYGPGFFVWWAYAYALLFAAAVRLVSGLLHLRRYYGLQFAIIVVALVCPWIGNAVYVLGVVPGPGLDFTNVGFAVSGLALAGGSLRWGLLDVMPITRDFVIEHMDDPMILADARDRVVDCNAAAAARLLACPGPEAIGRPAAHVVTGWDRVPALPGTAIVEVGGLHEARCYEAKVTAVAAIGGEPGRLVLYHDVTSREQLQSHLRQRALTDALTGLPNRRLFLDRVEHALAKAVRTGQTVAVLFCDLDDFKSVNDAHGHDVGDEVLLTIARRLESGVRSGDTVARLGGDEFALLLEDLAGGDEAEEVGRRLADLIAEPILLGGTVVRTPGSIGIAVSKAGSSTTRELLREADRAMYSVKGDHSRRIAVAGSGSAPAG